MKAIHKGDAPSVNPYTLQNVGTVIAHLERLLCTEGAALYWFRSTGNAALFRRCTPSR